MDAIIEVSEPSNTAESGYISRSVRVGDLPSGGGGSLPYRFTFEYKGNFEERLPIIVADADQLFEMFGTELSFATASLSIGVSSIIDTESSGLVYGSSTNQIVYNENDYSYANYLGSGGYSMFAQTLPHYANIVTVLQPPLVVDVDIDGIKGLEITISSFYEGLVREYSITGYVDIAMTTARTPA